MPFSILPLTLLLCWGLCTIPEGIQASDLSPSPDSWWPSILNCQGDSLQIDIDITEPSCAGDPAQVILQTSGGTTPYAYSADGGLNFQSTGEFTLSGGSFSLVIRDSQNCQLDTTILIPEPPPLQLVVVQDTFTAGLGDVINLLAIGSGGEAPLTYSWMPVDGLSCSDCPNPNVVAGQVTSYTVMLTDANGCSRSLSIAIDVQMDPAIYVPSAFSPNLDGINDLLQVYGSGIGVERVEQFQVWDRLGNLLWQATDFGLDDTTIGWDGTRNGKTVDPGTFVYVVVVRYIDGRRSRFSDTVEVVK